MKLFSLPTVIFGLLLHLVFQQTLVVEGLNATNPMVPAVIVFGDSIVDPGNNNVIKTIIKCNFPPYGVDFADHRPTGRFCNGKIPTDFIVSSLGVKELLPPYLGTYLSPQDLLTGVSFASGGTGYDPLTPKLASVLSMSDQLELFKEYKERVKAIAGEKRASGIISGSLYVVCAGSDDVANTYFISPFRKTHYDFPSYANLLLNAASTFIEELIHLGARKIGFVGIPPIGCVPSQRTLAGGVQRKCAEEYNLIANLYNNGIIKEIERINKKNQHPNNATVVYIDIYTILFDIIQHPNRYGFDVSNKGCCGTGDVEVSVLCNGLTSTICENVSEYVFWDSYHPTEKTYEILVDWVIKKYIRFLI